MGTFVSKDQILQACSVDLKEWLLRHHPHTVIEHYGSVVLLDNHSVSVKEGYHGFFDFKTGEKGNNLIFLQKYLNYSFPDAVIALIQDGDLFQEQPQPIVRETKSTPTKTSADIVIPEPASDFRRSYAYLAARGIPYDVTNELVSRKVLYESAKGHNLVFITPERDYYELRGTNSYADKRCKYRLECKEFRKAAHDWCSEMQTCPQYKKDSYHGSSPGKAKGKFWYFYMAKPPFDALFICEAALDAVSLYVLHQLSGESGNYVYAGIGGVGNQTAIDWLKKRQHCIIATDNDAAGEECRKRNAELDAIIPFGKDWNDDLQNQARLKNTT